MTSTSSSLQPGSMAPYGALPVPRLTPELLQLVRTGIVYSLAVVHTEGMPVPGPMVPYTLSPRIRHGDLTDIAPASAAAEVITMSAHTGTHIDALCHVGEHQDEQGVPDPDGNVRLFSPDGALASAMETGTMHGQTYLSIAEMPPIVTRGVLLDVAGYKGVSVLPDNYQITPDDILSTQARQETEVRPGTAVLIRTGFLQHWHNNQPVYKDAIAGINLEAAQLLLRQGMILAGADNMSVEALPPLSHPVHRFLITHHGVSHLENVYLDDLAEQHIHEFLLIVTPLRLQGSTGSWVHPIAIA